MTPWANIAAAILLAIAGAATAVSFAPAVEASSPRHFNLLIVVDGLRPDYLTSARMPHLYALGELGVFGDVHSAAFPTVTRVNSATISSGSYPARHGLMNNTMFVRGLADEPFSTARASNLRKLKTYSDGRLLDVPSIGELLHKHGLELFVTGSAGSGTSLLQNPDAGAAASIWTAGGFFVPRAARKDAVAAVGKLVKDDPGRTAWAFDACLYKMSGDDAPDAVIMWIHEVDSAEHRYGVGAPEALQAVHDVDTRIGRLIQAFDENRLKDKVNILVTSDHGFSTNAGHFNVRRTLRQAGFADHDVKIVGSMVFLERDDPKLLKGVVEALQRDPQVGNIYTRATERGSSQGLVAGTLSTAAIQWDNVRAADVLATPAWSNATNKYGFPGSSTHGQGDAAGHGSDSPYDLQVPLIAAGPDFKHGVRSRVPTGNVDLAPTVLYLLGIQSPPSMNGRVLLELLRDGPSPDEVAIKDHHYHAEVTLHGLRYEARLDTLEVGSTTYLRGAQTTRSASLAN